MSEHSQQGAESSAERVRAYLEEHGMASGIVTFEQSTKTAQMAADAMGCDLGQIVKSLAFAAGDATVIALVAGDRRGDAEAIARTLGAERVKLADPDRVLSATGYPVGAVSPFDLPADVTVLVDASLERFETVFPAGGTASSMVRLPFGELVRLTRGRIASISVGGQ